MNVATLLGVAHCIVDFSCALTVVSLFFFGSPAPGGYYQWVIVYNLMAFAGQPFWGWLLDRGRGYRRGIVAGFFCIGFGSIAVGVEPLLAVVILGCGNALFHAGAGAIVYSVDDGWAGAPGLFVAPGGLGLFAGMFLAPLQLLSPMWVLPLLVVTAWVFHRFVPAVEVRDLRVTKGGPKSMLPAVLVLLLIVVALRSFSGFAFCVPWKAGWQGLVCLALASFGGKACGGFIADRFGWRLSCSALPAVAALAACRYDAFLPAACLALFAFQCTTGVTLAGIQSLFPGRPAFSFGLPCFALLAGALPFLLPQPALQLMSAPAVIICLSAALAAWGGLTLYQTVENGINRL